MRELRNGFTEKIIMHTRELNYKISQKLLHKSGGWTSWKSQGYHRVLEHKSSVRNLRNRTACIMDDLKFGYY